MRIHWKRGAARVAAGAAVLLVGVGAAPRLEAQAAPERAPDRVIRVTGVGEVRVTPDVAHVSLAVETTGATAQAAADENARAMDRVIRAVTAAGVARSDIRTSGYTLYPEYARPTPGREAAPDEPRIIGYRATNTVTVRTADLTRVGPLIDASLAAGANRLHDLRFSVADAEAAQNQAVREATQTARRTAEAMAAALGVRLGEVVEAATSTDQVRPVMRFEAARAQDMASVTTPIEPGEQTVSASVVVAFRIVDP